MGTLPKFTLPGTTEICAEEAVTPSALSAIVFGELGELLTKGRAPFTLPTFAGAKLTVNAAELPGSTVSGRLRPLKPNPLPETVACETVKLELPVLLTEISLEFLLPRLTSPKATWTRLTDSCAGACGESCGFGLGDAHA